MRRGTGNRLGRRRRWKLRSRTGAHLENMLCVGGGIFIFGGDQSRLLCWVQSLKSPPVIVTPCLAFCCHLDCITECFP